MDIVNVAYPNGDQTGFYIRYYDSNNGLITTSLVTFDTGSISGDLNTIILGPYAPVSYWYENTQALSVLIAFQ